MHGHHLWLGGTFLDFLVSFSLRGSADQNTTPHRGIPVFSFFFLYSVLVFHQYKLPKIIHLARQKVSFGCWIRGSSARPLVSGSKLLSVRQEGGESKREQEPGPQSPVPTHPQKFPPPKDHSTCQRPSLSLVDFWGTLGA